MAHLDPRVVIEKTEIPHDNARASCTLQSSTVKDHPEFEELIIAYVAHHTEQIYSMAYPPDICLTRARSFLDNSIGFDNAVFMAMSGSEGGMNTVLNNICDGFKQEAKQAYFRYTIDQFIDPLTFEQVVEVMTEFKQSLGGYSPESFGYISPEQMAGNYRDILWNYINSLTRYRNLWAY
jgi:hypothetical protein